MEKLNAAISLLYSIPQRSIVSLKDDKVFLLTAKEASWVLKLLPYPEEETAFITAAMTYLTNRGFHDFNEIIPTKDGKSSAPWEQQQILITKRLRGRTPNFREKADVEACSSYLASLHEAAKGFPGERYYQDRNKWGKMIAGLQQGCDDLNNFQTLIAQKTGRDDFETIFTEHCPFSLREAKAAAEELLPFYDRLNRDQKAQGGFCHHDPAYHNFFIDEKGAVAAFDFDYVIADLAAHDIAALILKVLKTNHWKAENALAVLSAYGKRRKISKEEGLFIKALLRYPYDFRHAAFARFAEGDKSHRIEKKLRRLTRETDLRQEALREINRYIGEEL